MLPVALYESEALENDDLIFLNYFNNDQPNPERQRQILLTKGAILMKDRYIMEIVEGVEAEDIEVNFVFLAKTRSIHFYFNAKVK